MLRSESSRDRKGEATPPVKVVGFHVEGSSPSPRDTSALLQNKMGSSASLSPVIIPPAFQVGGSGSGSVLRGERGDGQFYSCARRGMTRILAPTYKPPLSLAGRRGGAARTRGAVSAPGDCGSCHRVCAGAGHCAGCGDHGHGRSAHPDIEWHRPHGHSRGTPSHHAGPDHGKRQAAPDPGGVRPARPANGAKHAALCGHRAVCLPVPGGAASRGASGERPARAGGRPGV